MKILKVGDNIWKFMQNNLNLSDEEMQIFRSNPRNERILSRMVPFTLDNIIVIEVVKSHGCNSGHRKGTKFYFDGHGNLLTKYCPERICVFALAQMNYKIFTIMEFVFAGIDPIELTFPRFSCPDVGLKNDGWGQIIMEIKLDKLKNLRKSRKKNK